MRYEIIPFEDSLIPVAGESLALRHRGDRQALPALPERFSHPETASTAVATFWQRKQATGVAAIQDGQLLGYLMGRTSHPGGMGVQRLGAPGVPGGCPHPVGALSRQPDTHLPRGS